VPYQTDLGHFLGHAKIGIHMAVYKNILQIMNAITPLAGGILIASFGFKHVFVFAALVLFTTLIPLHFIAQVYERYAWGYIETFKHLFAHKNRPLVYAYAADGAQGIISSIVWPVFIFELLSGNYMSVGFITSLTTIAILLLNVVVGKVIDNIGRDKVLKYSTLLSATGWLIKVFVDSAFQIFITDTYHRIGRAANRMTFDSSTYEQAADNGHYIDEFTTLKNMALDMGRVLMLTVVALMVYYVGNVRVVFVLAAAATLVMVLLNRQIKVR
jgi:MFS family permease